MTGQAKAEKRKQFRLLAAALAGSLAAFGAPSDGAAQEAAPGADEAAGEPRVANAEEGSGSAAAELGPADDPLMQRALAVMPMPSGGSGQPPRFTGWLQPWTAALVFGLPVVWALFERRRELVRAVRRSAFKAGEPPRS